MMEKIETMNDQKASEKGPETKGLSLDGGPSLGKMIFFLGIALAMSAYGPFMLFAPAPLAMSMLIYGQGRTFLGMVIMVGALYVASIYWPFTMSTSILFSLSGFYAYLLNRIVRSNISPTKGLIASGALVLMMSISVFLAAKGLAGFSIENYVSEFVTSTVKQIQGSAEYANVLAQADEEVLEFKALIQNPKEMTEQILTWIPAALVISVFLNLWASFYMLLRNSLIWRKRVNYLYGLRDLLYFKTPDFMVYPLILGLMLALFGESIWKVQAVNWGYNILYSLGVFYFFQGLGVFIDLLHALKIWGIFRIIVVVSMLALAWKLLILVGLFDNWFNFRKYFYRKTNEGDEL